MEKEKLKRRIKRQRALQVFVWLGILYCFVFNIIPMFGLIIGFKDYSITSGIKGIFTSEWVGLKYFQQFVGNYQFGKLVRNTVVLSLLKLVFTFPAPILFALILNDMKVIGVKKVVQTASYLPHFISWVIVSCIASQFLSQGGVINSFLISLGLVKEPVKFLTAPEYFWGTMVTLDVWKEMGWWTIIFLAAITGINSDYYEAAQIDGASRIQRTIYITLPCIKSTIIVVLIMTLGNLFGGGLSGSNFEQSYLFGNTVNADTSQIIQTYVFDVGLSKGRYAYATAVGLIQSVLSVIMITGSNFVAKKISGDSLY